MESNSGNAELGRYTELVGVYHADGSLLGELRYVWGKMRGTAHCALCDITHGAIREKASFRACREGQPIPLRNVHLDERDPDVQVATEAHSLCGGKNGGWRVGNGVGPASVGTVRGIGGGF